MVKKCQWGNCKSDSRYIKNYPNVFFIPFPKPKSNLKKCLAWIQACGRPHWQLNVKLINKDRYVCSKVRFYEISMFLMKYDCYGKHNYVIE